MVGSKFYYTGGVRQNGRVIHIVTFEACSGFSRVAARRIAQPPNTPAQREQSEQAWVLRCGRRKHRRAQMNVQEFDSKHRHGQRSCFLPGCNYPLAISARAKVRPRGVRRGNLEPRAVIVATPVPPCLDLP